MAESKQNFDSCLSPCWPRQMWKAGRRMVIGDTSFSTPRHVYSTKELYKGNGWAVNPENSKGAVQSFA